MTDDSTAEKNALLRLWPKANQFLCNLNMAQAEWRWLHDSKNGINLSNRMPLMKLFQSEIFNFDVHNSVRLFNYYNKTNQSINFLLNLY